MVPSPLKISNARSIFFKKWGVPVNKNNLHNRKKIPCIFGDLW